MAQLRITPNCGDLGDSKSTFTMFFPSYRKMFSVEEGQFKHLQVKQDLLQLPCAAHSICAATGGTCSLHHQSRDNQELTALWRSTRCLRCINQAPACACLLFLWEKLSEAQGYNPLTLLARVLEETWQWQKGGINHLWHSVHVKCVTPLARG